MIATDRDEYRRALQRLHETQEALEKLYTDAALDLARVRVVLAEGPRHERRLDALEAHAHGGPLPELSPGVQARLVRHKQEKP